MKINITHIAKLANLPLSKEEEKKLAAQLETTLEHIERLKEIDTTTITGTNEVTGLEDVLREDVAMPSLLQEEALINAKKSYNGFFVVPAILEEK